MNNNFDKVLLKFCKSLIFAKIMPFSVVEFLSNPNREDEFKTLTKEDLLHFVLHFDLQANGQMKKEEISRIVARKLVEEEIIDCYNTNETLTKPRQYTATNRIGVN